MHTNIIYIYIYIYIYNIIYIGNIIYIYIYIITLPLKYIYHNIINMTVMLKYVICYMLCLTRHSLHSTACQWLCFTVRLAMFIHIISILGGFIIRYTCYDNPAMFLTSTLI